MTEANHGLLKKFHGEQRSAKRNSLECDPDVEPRAPKGVRRVNGTNREPQSSVSSDKQRKIFESPDQKGETRYDIQYAFSNLSYKLRNFNG